jgi:hypothetical protein
LRSVLEPRRIGHRCDRSAARRRALAACVVAASLVTAPQIARADNDSAEPDPDEQTLDPGPLAATAAVLGGILVPGVGHAVGGDRDSALALLKIRGLGFLIAGIGGAWLGATGASRRAGAVPVAMVVTGGGLIILPWWADIYGAVGSGATGGIPRVDLPRLELDVSYAYVRDPQFAYSHFAAVEADIGVSSFRLRPLLWISTSTDNQRGRLEVAYRLRGPGAKRPSGDGSSFEVRLAGGYHLYPEESFSVITADVGVAGRYDMARVTPSLKSSFAELSIGLGLERIDYDVAGSSEDFSDMLVGGFAYGMYLGRIGEIAAFYEHRRDEYTGGLSPGRENGSGFLGHFGARGFVYVTRHVGVTAEYAAGAAHVAQIGLRVQLGGPL